MMAELLPVRLLCIAHLEILKAQTGLVREWAALEWLVGEVTAVVKESPLLA